MSEAMHEGRRRAERVDVQHKRAALATVAPIRDRIGGWQLRLARIHAHAARGNLPGDLQQSLRREIVELRGAVAEHADRLDQLADTLPDDVSANSWFTDTVRALQSIEAGATRTASLLH